jgi:uncharacterized ferredoxin-like protein
MTKLVGPQGLRGVDITTSRGVRKYNQNKKGMVEVSNAKDAKALKAEGFFEASLMGPTTNSSAVGYNCNECGFGSWFKKCGRCGHESSAPSRDGE